MIKTAKPLLSLTAADLMSQPVVVLPDHLSLRGAAEKLLEARVHGAPIVNGDGKCIGVLSSLDFLGWVRKGKGIGTEAETANNYFNPWRIVDPGELPEDSVTRYMTPDPVTVAPDTPITELARQMLDAHIHRLIVVETEGKPDGIVSCTDILAALANSPTEE